MDVLIYILQWRFNKPAYHSKSVLNVIINQLHELLFIESASQLLVRLKSGKMADENNQIKWPFIC